MCNIAALEGVKSCHGQKGWSLLFGHKAGPEPAAAADGICYVATTQEAMGP